MNKPFIDLHLHDSYSVLDGMIKLDDYIQFAKNNNLKALSVSNHGNIDGIIDMYCKCKDAKIKPIIGCEFYMSEGILDEDNEDTKLNFHINLYAKNHQGYKNLIKLTNWANKNNFYKKPRITFDILKEYSEGLICTSSCVGSIFAHYILQDNPQKAGELCLDFKNLFKDDFYIEFGYHMFDSEKKYILYLEQIAKILNIKTIITNDTHYLYKDDEYAHKILMCKGEKTIADENSFSYSHNYYKNYNEIKSIFSGFKTIDVDKCIDNVYEIIDKCEDLNIEFENYVYPELPIPDGETQDSYLFKSIMVGAKKKFKIVNQEIVDRLQYEFSVISKMKFSGYFNVVADYISWAKNNNIAVGKARGSSAGSLVAYVTDITGINPLEYDLLFERFLNPDRVSFPDIDTDFEIVERENLMNYLRDKYGENGCVQISTKGYLKGKSAIKTVASRLNLDFGKYNTLLGMVKNDPKIDTVEKVIESSPELQKKYNTDTEFQNVCELAKKIEGNIQSVGIHASGVILCHKDISDIVPIVRTKEGFGTAWSDKIVEKMGLIKYDILGLNNLTVIKEAVRRVDNNLDINNIPLDDDKTYKLLQMGYNLGIFQLESDGMKSLLTILQPTEIEHINAIVSLFRPGAMQFIDEYIENKNSGNITYFDERVEPILKNTYGVMCIPENELVNTISGEKQIKNLNIGDSILSYDKLNNTTINGKIKNIWKTGEKNIRKIKTFDNDFILTSDEHYILTQDGDKKAKDIISERAESGQFFYNEDVVFKLWKKSKNNISIGKNKAYILGLMLGDGDMKSSTPNICFKYKEDAENISKLISFEFGGEPKIFFNTRCWYAYCKFNSSPNRTNLTLFLDKMYGKDLWRVKSYEKKLPIGFIDFKECDRIELLRGLWDSDGSYNRSLTYKSTSVELIINIGELLSSLKISYYIKENNLVIVDQNRFLNILKTPKIKGKEIKLINPVMMPILREDFIFLLKSSKFYLELTGLEKRSIRHIFRVNKNIKYPFYRAYKRNKTFKKFPELFEIYNSLVEKLYYGDCRPVPIIENKYDSTQNCYDIEMDNEKYPYYFTKDIVVHNCYQEQVMAVARTLAGYTMSEADSLRRAIGKKKMSEMKKHEDKFIQGCINNGVTPEKSKELYDQIEKFAEYSFNKSHGMSYAHIAYQTAWLKCNYPLEYMTALLNANSDNLDKLTPYIEECYRLDINVLPPDINKSGYKFEHDKDSNAIRFGFNGIKHVGESSIEPLILERKNGEYKSISDVLNRIPSLNKTALESLIKVGAFNNIEEQPYKYLHLFDYMQKAKNKTDYKNGKIDLYTSLVSTYIKETSKHIDEVKELQERRKGLTAKKADKEIKLEIDKRLEQIYFNEKSKFEIMQFQPEVQILKDYEMELIGFPISNNPKRQIVELSDFIDSTLISDVKDAKNYGEPFFFIGKVKTLRRCPNGSYFVILTDEKEEIATFMKGDTYNNMSDKLSNTSNYFRICGSLNKSNNEKYDDNLKLESIRYFNASKDKEAILRLPQSITQEQVRELLTNIKNDAILNSEDINYRLSLLTYDNKKLDTKIDYWISDIQSIGSLILRYNLVVVN